MLLHPAVEADYPAIVDLVNLAYRGTGPSASWNVESGILEGQRLSESLLREDLAAKPTAHLLICLEQFGREQAGSERPGGERPEGQILGCVWLEPRENGLWYLGLLAVRPDQQKLHLGSDLLAAAEEFAQARGATRIQMTVLHVRQALIAWYLRRGYRSTGAAEPFPYGDERFGRPLRDDLYFVILEKDLEPTPL